MTAIIFSTQHHHVSLFGVIYHHPVCQYRMYSIVHFTAAAETTSQHVERSSAVTSLSSGHMSLRTGESSSHTKLRTTSNNYFTTLPITHVRSSISQTTFPSKKTSDTLAISPTTRLAVATIKTHPVHRSAFSSEYTTTTGLSHGIDTTMTYNGLTTQNGSSTLVLLGDGDPEWHLSYGCKLSMCTKPTG